MLEPDTEDALELETLLLETEELLTAVLEALLLDTEELLKTADEEILELGDDPALDELPTAPEEPELELEGVMPEDDIVLDELDTVEATLELEGVTIEDDPALDELDTVEVALELDGVTLEDELALDELEAVDAEVTAEPEVEVTAEDVLD